MSVNALRSSFSVYEQRKEGQLALLQVGYCMTQQSMLSEWGLPAFLLPELVHEEIPLPGPLVGGRQKGKGAGLLLPGVHRASAARQSLSCPQAPCPTSSKKRPSPGDCLLLSCKYQTCICTVGPVLVKPISMVVRLATLNRM